MASNPSVHVAVGSDEAFARSGRAAAGNGCRPSMTHESGGALVLAGDLHAVLGNDLPALRPANPHLQHVEDRTVVRVAAERLGVSVDRTSRQERDIAEAANREPFMLDGSPASLDSCDPGFLALGCPD